MRILERPHRRRVQRPTSTALIVAAVAAVATAIWTQVRARKAEREHPPVGRSIEVDGTRLHYVDRGSGPAVVLIHGNGVRLQDFIASGLIGRLSATHRVIAFDRPGYGFSERPRNRIWTPSAQAAVIHRALKRIGVDRAAVLGHSFGALVAAALALDHPERVSGLVLVGGYFYPTVRADVALVAPAALPIVGDVLRYTTMPVSTRMTFRSGIAAMFSPMDVPQNFVPTLSREMMLRPIQLRADAEDAASMIPAAARLQRRYRKLTMPVSIIAGEQDRIIDTHAHSERLHAELPRSTLTIVPGAGHMVHYAIAERIADEIDHASMTGGRWLEDEPRGT